MPRCRTLFQFLLAFSLVTSVVLPVAGRSLAQEATPVASPVASPVAAEDLYRDPTGTFTVPIPTGWTATPADDFVQLSSPEDAYHVYVMAIPDADVAAAIAAAWQLVEPGVERVPAEEYEIPPPPGFDRLLAHIYDRGIVSGTSVEAIGELVGETTFVLLFQGDADVAVRRSSQIQIISSGFEVLAVERTDLKGVQPRAFTPEMLDELTAYIESSMVSHDIPGATVAIVQNGEIIYRQGFGVRELGREEPVTPETLMMIGSATKSMTTMMMATVVDDGLMRWDTPVVDILPSFAVADPTISSQVTMQQLVCACTGVPRRDLEYIFNSSEMDPADVITSLASFPFYTPIGEAFQYSNQMVAAGGYITALAAGGSLPTLADDYIADMNERIFAPIGMDSTTLSMAEAEANPNHASSHARAADGLLDVQPLAAEALLTPVTPSALVWSNVDDLGKYLITLLAEGVAPDGERVVSAENLRETWLPQVPVSSGVSYGLGWLVDTFKSQPMIQHAGNMIGFTSDVAFLPESDLGIVILTNASLANLFTESIRYRAFEIAFDLEPEGEELIAFALEQQQTQLAASSEVIGPAPHPSNVQLYLGRYSSPVFGEVRITNAGGKWLFDAKEFQGEIRPLLGEAAQVAGYLLIDGPVVGLLLNLRMENGVPVLEVIDQVSHDVYPFAALDRSPLVATPVASPVASPAP